MSTTTVWSRDTNEHESLESDIELVEWHTENKLKTAKTMDNKSISNIIATSAGVNVNDTSATLFGVDQEQVQQLQPRLHGGAANAFDDISITSMSSAAEDDENVEVNAQRRKYKYMRLIKIIALLICWIAFTCMLLVEAVHTQLKPNFVCIPNGEVKNFDIYEDVGGKGFFISVSGPFVMHTNDELRKLGEKIRFLNISLQQATTRNIEDTHNVSKPWTLYIMHSSDLESVELMERKKRFTLFDMQESASKKLRLTFVTNLDKPLPLEILYEPTPVDDDIGVVLAIIIVVGFYILLMLDIVHRTLAIIVFCTLSIGMLAMMNMRPSLVTIIDWINFEVLLLIFAFTLIIAMLAETGIIDYLTLRIYQISNGHIWPILNVLCLINFIGSAFYDSLLLMILTAPITMRICEVMELNPIPLLTCLIISSNIGGVLTPSGDTPYSFIVNHEILGRENIDWIVFIAHILPGTLMAAAAAYIYMRILYNDSNSMRFKDGAEVERLRRVIKVWARTAKSISPYSRDEQAMRDTVMSKVRRLRKRLKRVGKMPTPPSNFKETLRELRTQFQITDYPLLIKCYFVLIFVFLLITLHLFPDIHYLSTAWTVLLACIILLILADTEDFDGILGRIEWSSMLFIACVIVYSEALTQLGIFDAIGSITNKLIKSTSSNARLPITMLIVLWISAFSAAFLTDSKVSAMMLRAVIAAVEDLDDEELPLQPLVWAVVLGTGLGGIGTIIGSFANVVCAGLAEKHGYNFPFLYYCKVGFPIMLVCVMSSTMYLMISHVLFNWHEMD